MDGSLDTNVLLRLATGDVPEQLRRAKALLGKPGARYVVADAAWIEIAYALEHHYGLGRDGIADVVRSLMSIDSVSADTPTIEATCASFLVSPKLSFTDCYLAARAATIGATPLFTFDQTLANQHQAARLVP